MEPLMISDEVAAFLRVDVVTIRRLVSRGELPAYRVGGEFRFTRTDLETYLQRQRVAGGEESRTDPLDALVQKARTFFPGSKGSQVESSLDRFDRFTKRARKVLHLAQEEAQRLNHNYMGTEHLLLGLVREGEGLAAQVLKQLGVNLLEVRSQVEAMIGRGDHVVLGELPLTPRSKKALALSMDEARRLNHQYVGTEHLLLALIREGDGVAAQVLKKLGVDLVEARAQTIRLLAEQSIASAPSQEAPEAETPLMPSEAASLVAEGEEALVCERCGAHSPGYFRYCFNCGLPLIHE